MNFNSSFLIVFLSDGNILPVEEIPVSLCSFMDRRQLPAYHFQILGQKAEQNVHSKTTDDEVILLCST